MKKSYHILWEHTTWTESYIEAESEKEARIKALSPEVKLTEKQSSRYHGGQRIVQIKEVGKKDKKDK